MTPTVFFRRITRRKLDDAIAWYEEQRDGLGREFAAEIDRVIGELASDPSRYPKVFQNVRVARTRRFPYSILFVTEDQRIVVLAVFHARRNPTEWSARV